MDNPILYFILHPCRTQIEGLHQQGEKNFPCRNSLFIIILIRKRITIGNCPGSCTGKGGQTIGMNLRYGLVQTART
jgi:hypothetical protein